MSESKDPGTGQEIDTIYLKPPLATDRLPPLFANNVRIMGTLDAMVLHLYFVSPTRFHGASEGNPQPGVQVERNIATIEEDPVARVALPISTAMELALLIFKQVVDGAPQLEGTLASVNAQITELLARANRDNADAAHSQQQAGVTK